MHPGLSWKTKKVRSRSCAHKNANSDCCDTSFQPISRTEKQECVFAKKKQKSTLEIVLVFTCVAMPL